VKLGDQFVLEIEKLTFGGAGLAHFDGRVVFVPYAAPLDKLKVEVIELKKNFLKAKILEILDPSPFRSSPRCKIYGQCGGCNWQHIDYQHQLKAKQEIIQEVWVRKLSGKAEDISPIIASPNIWNYRNRIQIKSQGDLNGFFARATHNIIDLAQCEIADEKINLEFQKWKSIKKPDSELSRFNFKITTSNQVAITNMEQDDEILGFSQVNTKQNEHLIQMVSETFSANQRPRILDLYGGPGNFSIPLALKNSNCRFECVEFNPQACSEGQRLSEKHQLKNIRIIQGEVGRYLKRISELKNSFVILDPPREGCAPEVMRFLEKLAPDFIVYISCDPMTWARDVKSILTNYRAAKIQGLDMFPHTDHIEIFSVWKNSKLL
jgi:23S rRNA (uracil1939-C5)-methyltransferase